MRVMLSIDELKQIKDSLRECKPDIDYLSWGPAFELACKRKKEALKIVSRAIKECKKNAES